MLAELELVDPLEEHRQPVRRSEQREQDVGGDHPRSALIEDSRRELDRRPYEEPLIPTPERGLEPLAESLGAPPRRCEDG